MNNPLITVDGCFYNDTPSEAGLQNIIMKDEHGQILAVQGGSLTLEKSIPIIAALREEQLLKSMQAAKKEKKALMVKSTVSNRPLRKSFSNNGFVKLAREIELMRDRMLG